MEAMTTGAGRSRSAARRRSSPSATAWKVPAVAGSARPRLDKRPRSSDAALRVKVSASTYCAEAVPSFTRQAMRRVSTRVLPEPAAASTHKGRA